MTVGELTKLLEGIAQGLSDLSKKTADGLVTFGTEMRPFAEQSVEQFAQFLRQCDEYQKTGTIPTGKRKTTPKSSAPAMSVSDAVEKVRAMLGEINQGTVTTTRIDSLLAMLKKDLKKAEWEKFLQDLDIAGKPKTKDQAAEKLRQVLTSQLDMYVKSRAFGG